MKYSDFKLVDGTYELKTKQLLRIWTQADGQWACVAYDHGPFCRRCHNLSDDETEIEPALISHVLDGNMTIKDDPDKGWLFQTAPPAKAEVERILARSGYTEEDLKGWDKHQLRRFLNGEKP